MQLATSPERYGHTCNSCGVDLEIQDESQIKINPPHPERFNNCLLSSAHLSSHLA